MNKKEASALIAIAVSALPNLQEKSLTATAAVWAMLMPDIDYATGKAAIIRLMREKRISTLPLPGEIVEIVRELRRKQDDAPMAIEAWEEVRKNINPYTAGKWSHPAIQKTIDRVGTRNICHGEFNIAQRFMDTYDQIVKQVIIDRENKLAIQITDKGQINFLAGGQQT